MGTTFVVLLDFLLLVRLVVGRRRLVGIGVVVGARRGLLRDLCRPLLWFGVGRKG